MRIALDTLIQHGSSLADGSCKHAYHHMLSQTYFIWPRRLEALFDTEVGRPPRATVFLRLESLHADFEQFCASRNASAACLKLRAHRVALERFNPSPENMRGKSSASGYATHVLRHELSDATLDAINRAYRSDLACFGYAPASRGTVCV